MEQNPARPENLVMTQADPAPPPLPLTPPNQRGKVRIDPETLGELKRLAERVGGLERLKEVIDALLKVQAPG